MKLIAIFILFLFTSDMKLENDKTIYDFSSKKIDGSDLNLSDYKGKPILIINVASKCGFTPQYEGLQKLQEKYGKDLVIIGFPANNFLKQEPGSNKEISGFCTQNYGVTFQMAEKVSVKGANMDGLFAWLTKQENPDFTGNIKWNFEKFLINKEGKLIHRFRSAVKPEDKEMIEAIELAIK